MTLLRQNDLDHTDTSQSLKVTAKGYVGLKVVAMKLEPPRSGGLVEACEYQGMHLAKRAATY